MKTDVTGAKPRPEAFDEASIAPRDDVRVHGAGLRCPFCHDAVDVDAGVACERCLARHHGGCWSEGGRCGACGHVVALAGRLRSDPEVRRRRSSWVVYMMGVAAMASAGIIVGAFVGYGRAGSESARSRAEVDHHTGPVHEPVDDMVEDARWAEETRKRDEAQRMFVNQAEATRAALELAEGKIGGPRHIEVVGGYAVVDAQGAWIFVETTREGVRIVAAGLGTTFLEAGGDAISFARPGGIPCSFAKTPGPPGTVMIADGVERTRIWDVTPAQRDAIVAALAAPPGEADIAALLEEHGYVRAR